MIYPVKNNHIGSVVSESFRYTHRQEDKQPDFLKNSFIAYHWFSEKYKFVDFKKSIYDYLNKFLI